MCDFCYFSSLIKAANSPFLGNRETRFFGEYQLAITLHIEHTTAAGNHFS